MRNIAKRKRVDLVTGFEKSEKGNCKLRFRGFEKMIQTVVSHSPFS